MNALKLKAKDECKWDLVSLGEVLLRFDPGDERIHNAQNFRVFDGGGEYNVARNLAKTFRQKTAVVTALADNALGRLAENLIWAGGVDASEILWREAENTRNGLYFIERGFGLRAPASAFDRVNTAVSQLSKDDVEWEKIFALNGSRWFHTGGVFTGLSDTTPDVALAAMRAAKENNTIISYDLNYRDSLWKNKGGRESANNLNRQLLKFADVVFGVFDFDSNLSRYDESEFKRAAEKMFSDYPSLKAVISTLRNVQTANKHELSAVCLINNEVFKAKDYKDVEVFDRVGSGDAFASGFIFGLLEGKDAQFAVNCGTAAAVLAMTTSGDNLAVTSLEIERLMNDGNANVIR